MWSLVAVVLAFFLGFCLGMVVLIWRMYEASKGAFFKMVVSLADKILHESNIDVRELWEKMKPVINDWFRDQFKNEGPA
ncbi:MAG: hypothetical protein PHU95_02280 [Candidatus Thermoplasmatota archaeon]|nr:hypothetical protein [Candidatus Thermoplasmatota archaeon]MDD5778259.1 hypothetical protein [Candidatus Thermoplasmatota archaeon]